MGEEPLGALLKGRDFYHRVEREMLKFQVTHSHSRSDHSVKWEKNDVGNQDCVRYRRGGRHPCVEVWECITFNTQLCQTDGDQPSTPRPGPAWGSTENRQGTC